MSRADRRLRRHIDALLKDRRPRRGPAGEDAPALQLAASLRAAHTGTAEPSPGFVDDLARRLRRLEEEAPQPRRRQFLAAGLATAAASVGAGIGIERLREVLTAPADGTGPIQPYNGAWVAVATVAELTPGQVRKFSSGGVEGFVLNTAGRISGLSAVCTHQGCILTSDPANSRLECPCHRQSFALDGRPNPGDYRLNPLPAIQTRVNGEHVEALVPNWV